MARTTQGATDSPVRFADAPTQAVVAARSRTVYRELGAHHGGVPLVGLTHLGANLDSWDPEVVDPLAADRRVILLGCRGVGAAGGDVRDRCEDMTSDAIAAIRALGLTRVDLLGLSLGGMVAQEILRQAPDLVDRVILASAGPQGPGYAMTGATVRTDRDKPVTPGVFRAQLRAVSRWGHQTPPPPPAFSGPMLILHGDSDRMVPAANADALLARFPDADVRMFLDSGHGVVFQQRHRVTDLTRSFLRRAATDPIL